jgi:N-acetyl-anhydromuramyl-L-alanine amidase AmpD
MNSPKPLRKRQNNMIFLRRLFAILAIAFVLSGAWPIVAAQAAEETMCCLCTVKASKKNFCVKNIPKEGGKFKYCTSFMTDLDAGKSLSRGHEAELEGFSCELAALSAAQCQLSGGSTQAVCPEEPTTFGPALISKITKEIQSTKGLTDFSNPISSVPGVGVAIPGLKFSSPKIVGEYLYVSFLGEYIAAAFRYALGIVVICAIVMVIYGGFRYLVGSAAGSVKRGKTIIIDALAGVIITLGAFLILQTINPQTLNLDAVKIPFIVPEDDHKCDDPREECDAVVADEPTITGACTSDKSLAMKSRKASIDFSLFGNNDNRTSKKREIKNIKRVVIHNGGYNAQQNSSTWQKRKASAHYTIDRNGKIFQHIGEECPAWHAGKGGNIDSIGIELNIGKFSNGKSCNDPPKDVTGEDVEKACSPTKAQYSSLKSLIDDILTRTSVRVSSDTVLGHCEVPGSTHADPRAFDWSRIGLNNEEKKSKVKRGSTACNWYLPF